MSKNKADKYYNILKNNLIYNSDKESMVTIFGKKIKIPRKQVAYGDYGTFYNFSGVQVNAQSWNNKDDIICRVIKNIKHMVEIYSGEKFNFVLINYYANGDQCIGYHSDDERDLDKFSSIVGVSLGSPRDFLLKPKNFITKNLSNPIKINLDHGSIILMKYPTNKYWTHSIPRRTNINNPRISLTFRKIICKE
jgi:alkylated DNA repair dioxygenase AlkB